MALTAAQRAQIRMRLDWPARFLQTDDRLEQAMSPLVLSAEDEALLIVELERLNTIDAEIDAMELIENATQADTIQMRPAYALSVKRARQRESIRRISNILGVPRYSTRNRMAFAGRSGPED